MADNLAGIAFHLVVVVVGSPDCNAAAEEEGIGPVAGGNSDYTAELPSRSNRCSRRLLLAPRHSGLEEAVGGRREEGRRPIYIYIVP